MQHIHVYIYKYFKLFYFTYLHICKKQVFSGQENTLEGFLMRFPVMARFVLIISKEKIHEYFNVNRYNGKKYVPGSIYR